MPSVTTARRICGTLVSRQLRFWLVHRPPGLPVRRLAFCSFSRLALGLDLLRSFAFCLCGSLHLRDPGSFSLCLLGRLALGFSRSVALRLLGSFTLHSLDGFEPRLHCCLALRLLRSFAPGFLRGGKPCSLGCGFA